jgi:hypothetical protein
MVISSKGLPHFWWNPDQCPKTPNVLQPPNPSALRDPHAKIAVDPFSVQQWPVFGASIPLERSIGYAYKVSHCLQTIADHDRTAFDPLSRAHNVGRFGFELLLCAAGLCAVSLPGQWRPSGGAGPSWSGRNENRRTCKSCTGGGRFDSRGHKYQPDTLGTHPAGWQADRKRKSIVVRIPMDAGAESEAAGFQRRWVSD